MDHSGSTRCKRMGVRTPRYCASTCSFRSSLRTLHVIKTFYTNTMHMHYMVPHQTSQKLKHNGTAQTRRHRPEKIFTFCFLLFLVLLVVLFFIGSNGRIISHKHHAAPRGWQYPRLWIPTLMFFMAKPSGNYSKKKCFSIALRHTLVVLEMH